MKFCSRSFIFFILLFSSSVCSAQKVFIANDFGNCGVGLRDSSGKWLAEPIYQSITNPLPGYYKVMLGSKEGVIDSTGAVIIPPAYDFLDIVEVSPDSVSDLLFFTVYNDGKAGLLNTKREIIIPLQYRYVDVGYDGTIIAKISKKRYSLFDIYGKETIIPGKQPAAPEPIGSDLIQVARNTCWPVFSQKYHQSKKYSWRGFYYPVLTLSKRYGVMNDSLRLLIPKEFHDISYRPGKYNLVDVSTRRRTGFYTISGKEVWAPVFKIQYNYRHSYSPSYGSIATINRFGFTAAEYNNKWGIIGVNGDTVLPFIYSYIRSGSSFYSSEKNAGLWIVDKGNYEGAFDPEKREWIIKPEYTSLYSVRNFRLAGDTSKVNSFSRINYYSIYDQQGLKIYIAHKNDKYGIITSSGQELLPFDYDEYTYTYSGYIFERDSTFISVSFPDYSGEKRQYTSQQAVAVAPADEKFQKITYKNGDVLWINPDLLRDTAQLKLYSTHVENYVINNQTYNHQLHAAVMTISSLQPSEKFKMIPGAVSVRNTDLNYRTQDSVFNFIIYTKPYLRPGEISVIGDDSKHTYYSVARIGGILRDDGFQVIRAGSYNYISFYGIKNNKAVFTVTARKNKNGLIDGDGKLLVDTVWRAIGPSYENYFWVRKSFRRYSYRSYCWNILDTTTGKLLLPKKLRSSSASAFGTDAVVLEHKGGPRLYNYRTGKFILQGGINEIERLDSIGRYFAVRTCYGHIGIIDGNGNWLADTIWTALINANNLQTEITGSRYYYRYYVNRTQEGKQLYCVLSNDTGWIIYNGRTGTVSKDPALRKFLLNISCNNVNIDTSGEISQRCSDCPSWIYRDSTNEKVLMSWQQKMLFDSLFTGEHFIADSNYFWHVYPCIDCLKKNPHAYYEYTWAKNYDREGLLHFVNFNNDSCISVSRKNLTSYQYNKKYPCDLFFTAVMYADGPHPFQLDSLFEGTAWKKFISDEVSTYFESNPDIKGNCHNPYMLPLVLKDRFILTPKGIELFPPGFSEDEAQLFVPISWEKLKPYMRKDVIRKLGI